MFQSTGNAGRAYRDFLRWIHSSAGCVKFVDEDGMRRYSHGYDCKPHQRAQERPGRHALFHGDTRADGVPL